MGNFALIGMIYFPSGSPNYKFVEPIKNITNNILPGEHLFTYICPRPTGIAKKHFKGEIFNFLKIVYLHTCPVYNIIFC
jgi:hypothetical protein